MIRTRWGLGVAVLLVSHICFAAEPLPPPPPPPPPPPVAPAGADCYPACRAGYFCSGGQCVSACNPPCGPGEVCSSTGQCLASEAPLAEPRRGDVDDGPAPAGYHYESRRRIGMLIGGLVPLAIGYGFSIIYGVYMMTDRTSGFYHGTGNLLYFVPVLGPLLRMGYVLGSNTSGYSLGGIYVDLLLTIAFSAAEIVGFVFTLLGITKTTKVLVRDGESAREVTDDGPKFSFAPLLSPYGGGGLTFVLNY